MWDYSTELISIHTPLAGSDLVVDVAAGLLDISIHTPLAGSDRLRCGSHIHNIQFQSTLPLRGATSAAATALRAWAIFQSTLPLRGATPHTRPCARNARFQSTLPLRGATCLTGRPSRSPTYFNPHSPCGERLYRMRRFDDAIMISIHTPLAGSDPHRPADSRSNRISIHTPLAGSDSSLIFCK